MTQASKKYQVWFALTAVALLLSTCATAKATSLQELLRKGSASASAYMEGLHWGLVASAIAQDQIGTTWYCTDDGSYPPVGKVSSAFIDAVRSGEFSETTDIEIPYMLVMARLYPCE